MRQLVLAGVVLFLVLALALFLLMLRYQGTFTKKVNVTAVMTSTGDGLAADADVKYRGVLVGAVESVEIAAEGREQHVQLNLKPEYAKDIPSSVTARVVPSNVFAVTSIELVSPEKSSESTETLSEGATVKQDTSKGTVALQDTLTKLKKIINSIQPENLGNVLGSLSYALEGSARVPGSSIDRLDRLLTAIDTGTPTGQDLLSGMAAGIGALNESAPELLNVLGDSVSTAQLISQKQAEFEAVLYGGGIALDATNTLFANNPNAGKDLASGGANVFGALASDPTAIAQAIPILNDQTIPAFAGSLKGNGNPREYVILVTEASLTPFKQYGAAECPRYGTMAGPSCATAPAVGDPGYLPPELRPRWLDAAGPRPLLLPQLPAIPELQQLLGAVGGQPAPTSAPSLNNPFAGTPLEGLFPQPAIPASAQVQPAEIRPAAFVGPAAVTAIVGDKPDATEMLLLGSALRGSALKVSPDGSNR